MKKLAIFVVVMLLCTFAFAENIDFSGMSDVELNHLIEAAQAELKSRSGEETTANSDDMVILDHNDLTVTIKDLRVESDWLYGDSALIIDVVEVNNSDKKLNFNGSTISVNGWQVDSSAYGELEAGKKSKGTFKLKLEDADISSLEEVKELEFVFTVFDDDLNFEELSPVTIELK